MRRVPRSTRSAEPIWARAGIPSRSLSLACLVAGLAELYTTPDILKSEECPNLKIKEDQRYAKNHAIPLVRRQRRRSHEPLRFGVQEFQGRQRPPIWKSGTGSGRYGYDRSVPDRGTGILCAEWGSAVQIHAGDITVRELRDAARGRRSMGEAFRRRKKRQMRLATGQIRFVVADHSL